MGFLKRIGAKALIKITALHDKWVFNALERPLKGDPYMQKFDLRVAVVRQDGKYKEVLLLRRNPDGSCFQDLSEIPGGKIDANDKSIRHALQRVVFEKTGLKATSILPHLTSVTGYTTGKTTKNVSCVAVTIRSQVMQLNFVVTVDGDGEDFVVNKEEHSTGAWVSEWDLDGYHMTDDMEPLVLRALAEEGWLR